MKEEKKYVESSELVAYIQKDKKEATSIHDVKQNLLGKNRVTEETLIKRGKHFKRKVESWEEVRQVYIFGVWNEDLQETVFPKKAELADQLGVSYNTIVIKVKEGKWDQMRTLYRSKLEEKQEQDELRGLLSESAMYEQQQLRNFEKIQILIEEELNAYKEEEVVIDEFGERRRERKKNLNARDLKQLTDTLVTCRTQIKEIIGTDEITKQVIEDLEEIRRQEREERSGDDKLKAIQSEVRQLQEERKKIKKKNETRGATRARYKEAEMDRLRKKREQGRK